MKINKLLFCLLSTILILSCNDDDALLESIDDNGAIIEVLSTANNVVFNNNLDGTLDVIVEYRDNANGNLLDQLNVYVTYFDDTETTGDSSTAIERQEVFLRTIEGTEFITGDNGFPIHNLLISTQDFLSITNNTLEGIAANDIYITRLELVLTDGSVFSTGNIGNNGGLSTDFDILTTVQ